MPGLTLRGCLYELRTLGPLTGVSAGSASDGDDDAWPTPKARDFRSGGTDPEINEEFMKRRPSMGSIDLPPQVVQVELAKNGNQALATGTLNPEWVEILMGWPIGWTDTANPCPGIWPGWPAGMGPHQHAYEPPRIAPKGAVPNRVARIKACGNGVVPHQAAEAYFTLLSFAAPYLETQA